MSKSNKYIIIILLKCRVGFAADRRCHMSRHMPEHVSEHVSKHMSKTRLNERTLNYVFCAVFVFELLVKIVAFGPAQYSPRRRPPHV